MRKLTTLERQVSVTGTVAASGDTTLIAAPGANRQIVISAIILANNSGSDTSIVLKFGAASWLTVPTVIKGDGLAWAFAGDLCWEVGENLALVLNLSAANSVAYTVVYWINAE